MKFGPYIISFALMCTVAFIALWMTFVRPVQSRSASGVITQKNFKGASTYSQQPSGLNRGFTTPTDIAIAESYVFEIQLDGIREPVRFWQNTIASRDFKVGQRVRVEYKERGIPLFWKRRNVMDMKPEL
ncbi:MAG: hypothetical protein ACR2NN_06060 [Bryobacteraceae bacterium]